MSDIQDPPAGWTLSQFKAVCADVGSWTWGTVQGAFNEKATLTQIIVDAVIGMIPLLGDATAVRDLIAVIIGLSVEEEKRNSKWEWMLLVVFLFALIPVLGGVVKGVGRIVVKAAQEAAVLAGPAKMAHLHNAAKEVTAFLNRIGMKNAEKWLLSLRINDHLGELIGKFTVVMTTLDKILEKVIGGTSSGVSSLVSQFPKLKNKILSLRAGLAKARKKGEEMIPLAVKEFDQYLREIQAYIRTGGETTSRLALHEVATGQRVTTRVEERRLIEQGELPTRTLRGGFEQNPSSSADPGKIAKYYKHEVDYPNLFDSTPGAAQHEKIAAFAGKMINRSLKDGEEVFRFFGPKRTTHGFNVDEASAGGGWWGLGRPPKTAKEWRELAAVLDSFNGDGFYMSAKVVGNRGPKAVVGTISEQFGEKIPGQYLPGGATQAFFYLDRDFSTALTQAGRDFMLKKSVTKIFDPATGMEFTFHRTEWTDANGIWGYIRIPSAATIQTARVGSREMATKENREVTIHP
jgi:hypothetical protein